jgi:methionyl-tRNA formyltransferase
MKLSPSAVKVLARQRLLPLEQPSSLKGDEAQQLIRACAPQVLVVAAYGLILPQAVLDLPQYGAINVHASLLPRWRGAAPIQRAILAGDRVTGITIMQMDAGLDTGYVLNMRNHPLSQDDTSGSVEKALARLGSEALLETLDLLARAELRGDPQPAAGATYANKIRKEEARLDFGLPAAQLDRVVRAFNPSPVAFTQFRGETLRVWRARPTADTASAPAGTIEVRSDASVRVACGDGALLLLEVQRPGGKPMDAAAWAAGTQPRVGERLGL